METNAVDSLGKAGVRPANKPSANPRSSQTPEIARTNSGEDSVTLSSASRAAASAQKLQNNAGGSTGEEIRRETSSSREESSPSPSNLRQLSVTGNQQVVLKIIDPSTKNVVRQLPPEELLRLREAVRSANESSAQIQEN